MRYNMQQNFFSLTDSFDIRDEHDEIAFRVRGAFFSLRKTLSFQDSSDTEIASITELIFAFRSTYRIQRNGKHFADMSKNLFNFFHDGFTIETQDNSPDMQVDGNIWDLDYSISRGGKRLATVSKALVAVRDTYTVDIAPHEDPIDILPCVVVIDILCHNGKS
ncbi:LURP-one-related family protein [Chloroflexi bacterium TSY]|nr:LURP-one-related family protein [Chloroflexi bacterium TSY]